MCLLLRLSSKYVACVLLITIHAVTLFENVDMVTRSREGCIYAENESIGRFPMSCLPVWYLRN